MPTIFGQKYSVETTSFIFNCNEPADQWYIVVCCDVTKKSQRMTNQNVCGWDLRQEGNIVQRLNITAVNSVRMVERTIPEIKK